MKEVHKIKDLAHIRLLSDPLKLQLIRAFAEEPKTTKQVAAALGESVTKLYRHVDALFDAGLIEVIDGRWGASLEINPNPNLPPDRRRPVPLLLFDLWNDPNCLQSLHEERPDLVANYTAFLEEQWEAHHTLRKMFTTSEAAVLTPEQLEALRALGYIR